MKILHIRWKNFNSYGNKFTTLDFTQLNSSFSLVTGSNGSGKSSIHEIITFALYGKVPSKKMGDLPNRLNKELLVEIELLISNKKVFIRRGLEPNMFEVQVENDFNIADKAGKLSVQDYLENELYGIPSYVFHNIISLSINDFKSFIRMRPADKRTIIDKIFGLSVINKMYELLKRDLKKIKEKEIESKTTIKILIEQINSTIEQLKKLNNKIKESSSDRKNELKETIKKIKSDIPKLEDQINDFFVFIDVLKN